MSPISFQYKYLCDSIDCGSMTSDYGRKPTDHMDGCDDDDGDEDDEVLRGEHVLHSHEGLVMRS